MKKIILSLIAIIFGISLITNAQIPNSGFENWTQGNPDDWACSNVIDVGLFNITQTTDSHSGTYAVEGEVVDFFTTTIAPFVASGPDATGFAISEQYRLFELFYKFTPVGGDKFSVNVILEKSGAPIAQGAVALPAAVGSYTQLAIPLTYTVEEVPDLALIEVTIIGPVTGPDVHSGSKMYVDDLSFSLETGIYINSTPIQAVKCYPIPASDIINIEFNNDIQGEVVLKVFDIFGKEVKSLAFHQQQSGNSSFGFSVGDLSSGLYFYSVIGQSGNYSGKFTINR